MPLGLPAMKARFIDPGQMEAYEDSLKVYRDLKGVIDTSHDEGYDEGLIVVEERGIDKGRKQEKIDMARRAVPLKGYLGVGGWGMGYLFPLILIPKNRRS